MVHLQKRHDGLLVRHVPDVGGVDGQDPVAHPQLPRGRRRPARDNFTDVDSLKQETA